MVQIQFRLGFFTRHRLLDGSAPLGQHFASEVWSVSPSTTRWTAGAELKRDWALAERGAGPSGNIAHIPERAPSP